MNFNIFPRIHCFVEENKFKGAVSGFGRLGSSRQILNSWYGNPKSSFKVFVLVRRTSAFIKGILPSFFLNFASFFD